MNSLLSTTNQRSSKAGVQEEIQETAVDGRVVNVSDRCLVRTPAKCALVLLGDWPNVCRS